jgi:hypothetical protein
MFRTTETGKIEAEVRSLMDRQEEDKIISKDISNYVVANYKGYKPAEAIQVNVIHEQTSINLQAQTCRIFVQVSTAQCEPGQAGWLHVGFNQCFQTSSRSQYRMSEGTINSEENFKISVAQWQNLWTGKNETTLTLGKQIIILKQNTGPRHTTTNLLLHDSKLDDNKRCTPAQASSLSPEISAEVVKARIEVILAFEVATLDLANQILLIPKLGVWQKMQDPEDRFMATGPYGMVLIEWANRPKVSAGNIIKFPGV